MHKMASSVNSIQMAQMMNGQPMQMGSSGINHMIPGQANNQNTPSTSGGFQGTAQQPQDQKALKIDESKDPLESSDEEVVDELKKLIVNDKAPDEMAQWFWDSRDFDDDKGVLSNS